MGLVAFGTNTLELAGRCFDEVVLHTYFTDETTARCVQTVKDAAEKAGRDPASVRVWSCFATIGDHIARRQAPHEVGGPARHLSAGLRRSAGAYQRLGPRRAGAVPGRRRRQERAAASTSSGTTEQLEHVATLIPDEWLAPSATGTPEQCVKAIKGQFALGCDGVIMHGASPAELEPIVAAYRAG